ncbi:DUF4255 domain-containing protein [Magnetospirillum aberrantis]|uniref:DUF4255 domain-containing protein n=1 Tax=Magnetospirillum aberrantis SpK TaxID=908842 RepID=A0A7C9QU37_9PROT|nr:DUF4255 domain-containing protein [Magnetospirillum aberrantis]NFV80357.1 DUF4255 domain-containing protein [Magnetospirillum aberrantis SpK]
MALDPAAIPPTPSTDGQIVARISRALARLVRAGIPELRAENAVVFDSPAEIDSHDENKLSLFLYQIDPNPWLANLPRTLERGPSGFALRPAPMVVDLIYMMVPYAKSAEIELVLADKLVRLLHLVPALAGPMLDPVLERAGNHVMDIVPQPENPQLMRDLWGGFPGKSYKLTKLYRVTPVRIPGAGPEDVDMVETALLAQAPPPSAAEELDHG